MNDFTKDELGLLIYYIGLTLDQRGLDLAVKIQSMIDNYCEHESKEGILETFCCGEIESQQSEEKECQHEKGSLTYIASSIMDDDDIFKCKKCGEFYKLKSDSDK
jgi:hypothetical protein